MKRVIQSQSNQLYDEENFSGTRNNQAGNCRLEKSFNGFLSKRDKMKFEEGK